MTTNNGTGRWQLWVSVASVAVVVGGSILALYQTATAAYDKALDDDRRIAVIERDNRDMTAELAEFRANQREIETQFRASDQVRNLMHANDLRIQSMLWKKTFGSEYPTANAYYPTIAQDGPPK